MWQKYKNENKSLECLGFWMIFCWEILITLALPWFIILMFVSRLSLVPSIHISWGTEELLCCHCHLLHELGTLMNKISIISHIPDNCPEAYFTPSPTLYYKMRILGHHLNWAILCLERPEQSMVTTFNCWYVCDWVYGSLGLRWLTKNWQTWNSWKPFLDFNLSICNHIWKLQNEDQLN